MEFHEVCASRGYKGIPQVWGAIDCTHIRITRPQDSGAQFVDRKADYSILLQAVCDAAGVFLDVETGDSGRIHDASMLSNSRLGKVGGLLSTGCYALASCVGTHMGCHSCAGCVCSLADSRYIQAASYGSCCLGSQCNLHA